MHECHIDIKLFKKQNIIHIIWTIWTQYTEHFILLTLTYSYEGTKTRQNKPVMKECNTVVQ
jgi:hypothetical protein